MIKKLESSSVSLKLVPDCHSAENAANSAAKLIGEYLIQVYDYYYDYYL